MTVQITGNTYKITLTKDELKALRPSMPYPMTSIIGEAEANGEYAHAHY